MIGVSLSLELFFKETVQSVSELLDLLKKQGVDSIELRGIKPRHSNSDVLHAAELLWNFGFNVTFHGNIKTAETALSDIFSPLQDVFLHLNGRQEKATVIIHPISGDNVKMLCSLSEHAEKNSFPIVFALENNRLLPDKSEGDCTAFVLDIVKKVSRDNVGICFDMGHFEYYVKKNLPDKPQYMPSDEFFKYVVHTHIHALNGLITHFPLGEYELRLREYLEKLACDYFGVYNIELTFPRFEQEHSREDAINASVECLKDALPNVC